MIAATLGAVVNVDVESTASFDAKTHVAPSFNSATAADKTNAVTEAVGCPS